MRGSANRSLVSDETKRGTFASDEAFTGSTPGILPKRPRRVHHANTGKMGQWHFQLLDIVMKLVLS
jgi:hypothetical protein